MQITKGRQNLPYKTVIYGPEGIGKTTFAAQFPDPLFIDTEGSTARMDVARLPKPSSWSHLKEMIEFVIREKPCQTLIIDTADWAEDLCAEYVIQSGGEKIKSIEDFGYGKGYTILSEQFGRFLNKLTEVTNVGIHVVLTAHAMMRKFERPEEMGAYDRWELKLEKKTAPLVKEWADMILFANYKIFVTEDSKTKSKKGTGGQRVMYTTHHPAWDAKNRDGLPEEMPFEFAQIAHLFNQAPVIHETRTMQVEVPTAPVQVPAKQEVKHVESVKIAQETQPSATADGVQVTMTQDAAPELEAYPAALPAKVADLLRPMNATASNLMTAIGPTTTGGLGFWPAEMTIDKIPDEFWDYVVAEGWTAMIQPKIEELMMQIPY